MLTFWQLVNQLVFLMVSSTIMSWILPSLHVLRLSAQLAAHILPFNTFLRFCNMNVWGAEQYGRTENVPIANTWTFLVPGTGKACPNVFSALLIVIWFAVAFLHFRPTVVIRTEVKFAPFFKGPPTSNAYVGLIWSTLLSALKTWYESTANVSGFIKNFRQSFHS